LQDITNYFKTIYSYLTTTEGNKKTAPNLRTV
jgi:hypothetical protein